MGYDNKVRDLTFSDLEWMLVASALIDYRSDIMKRKEIAIKENRDSDIYNKHIKTIEAILDRMGSGLTWE